MVNTALLVRMSEWTNRTLVLPIAVFFPTSRCNSRCVSCDWWRASGDGDLSVAETDAVAASLARLGTRLVLFSGGEPLLRPEVFEQADAFKRRGATLHLHTSGILLDRLATKVADTFARVIVSLDAADETQYRAIRGVAALRTIEHGVARLRARAPRLPVTARSTVHKLNFRELPRLVRHAKAMSLDAISFLPADTTSSAFGRSGSVSLKDLALNRGEIVEFADLVERVIVEYDADFKTGFIAESPAKLRRLPQYYAALAGFASFPAVQCNAPYVSVVIEADGAVRPCYFHERIGSVRSLPLETIVRRHLPEFRATWSAAADHVCERCVCPLKTGWRSAPWL